MTDFYPHMSLQEVNAMSMLALAHVGDGVYELLTRTRLCEEGHNSVSELHRLTVKRVNAPAQAKAAQVLLPHLSEEELHIYKRGRNAKVNSVPQAAAVGEYHSATGLEALFGWLYLLGRTQRIFELYELITEGENNAT